MEEIIVKLGERELGKLLLADTDAEEVLQRCGEGHLKFPTNSERAGCDVDGNVQLVAGIHERTPRAGDSNLHI